MLLGVVDKFYTNNIKLDIWSMMYYIVTVANGEMTWVLLAKMKMASM